MQVFLWLAAVFGAIVMAEKPQFTYRNDTSALSPLEWAKGYPECGGSRQSPIDIVDSNLCAAHVPAPWTFSGSCPNFIMAENSEGYKAAVNGGNCTVATKEKSYKLAQFHIHIPSEHTIGGKAFDGELHFVHLSDDNKTALVAGLFLQKSDVANTKSAIGNIVDAMDSVSASRSIPVILDSYAEIIESNVADSHVFNYPGSLTTPPCSEIVDWWVVRKPIAISTDEYNRIMSNLAQLEITNDGKNARWTQPLYQRTVKIYN